MNTITRKIALSIVGEVKEGYKKLYDWNEMVFRAANTAVNHLYFQNKMNEFFYLTESAKILFADINKTADKMSDKEKGLLEKGYERVLTTSKQNTTYQVLSSHFKGKMPSDIFSNLNAQITATFAKEAVDYFSGKRSLRSYRRDMPMPFSAHGISNIIPTEDRKNYTFNLMGLTFKTYFGRDLSGNKTIFERALTEDYKIRAYTKETPPTGDHYKLCNSSLKLDGKNIYLLAVFQFEKTTVFLHKEKIMYADLSPQFPIILSTDKKVFCIGDRRDYLSGRLNIQALLKRTQINARTNKGGKGRKKKLHSIDHFEKMENKYINRLQHIYTRQMIDKCIQNKCGKLLLNFRPELPEPGNLTKGNLILWKRTNQLLLRNWGYNGLLNKIEYKSKKVGIEVIEQKPIKFPDNDEGKKYYNLYIIHYPKIIKHLKEEQQKLENLSYNDLKKSIDVHILQK